MPDVIEWCGHSVNLRDIYFEPMCLGSDALGIRLLIPNVSSDQLEYARAALREVIQQMLGELEFAQVIQAIEVATLRGSSSRYLALVDLRSFIRWWLARRRHARPKWPCTTTPRVPGRRGRLS